ncbi:hypothetical protein EQH57_0167, partial [Dictyocoela roeselum]
GELLLLDNGKGRRRVTTVGQKAREGGELLLLNNGKGRRRVTTVGQWQGKVESYYCWTMTREGGELLLLDKRQGKVESLLLMYSGKGRWRVPTLEVVTAEHDNLD